MVRFLCVIQRSSLVSSDSLLASANKSNSSSICGCIAQRFCSGNEANSFLSLLCYGQKKKQLDWSIFTFFLTLLLFYYSSIVHVGHCEYPQDFCCPSLSLFTQSKWGIFGNLHRADTWEKVPEQEYLLLLRPVMQGESAMAVDVWAHLRKAKRCGHWLTIWNRSAIRLLMAVQLSAQKKWTLSSCFFCFQRCGLSIVYNHDGHYIMDHSNCKAKLLRSIFKANFLSIIAMEG